MKIESIEKLIQAFLESKKMDFLMNSGLLDEDLTTDTLWFFHKMLLEHTERTIDYTDKEILDIILFVEFPKEFMDMPEEMMSIYFVIINFYTYLYEEKIIDKTEYDFLLHYFQEYSFLFFKRMHDMRIWTLIQQGEDALEEEKIDKIRSVDELIQKVRQNMNTMKDYMNNNNNVIPIFKEKKLQYEYEDSAQNWVLQLKISLNLNGEDIWRRILVPATITYQQLHGVIQNIFEWQDQSEHQFFPLGVNDFNSKCSISESRCIQDDFYQRRAIQYIYGSEDFWQHRIYLEKYWMINDVYAAFLPFCITGSGRSPLDYLECIIKDNNSVGTEKEIIKTKSNMNWQKFPISSVEQYKDTKQYQRYNQAFYRQKNRIISEVSVRFDRKIINQRLSQLSFTKRIDNK